MSKSGSTGGGGADSSFSSAFALRNDPIPGETLRRLGPLILLSDVDAAGSVSASMGAEGFARLADDRNDFTLRGEEGAMALGADDAVGGGDGAGFCILRKPVPPKGEALDSSSAAGSIFDSVVAPERRPLLGGALANVDGAAAREASCGLLGAESSEAAEATFEGTARKPDLVSGLGG